MPASLLNRTVCLRLFSLSLLMFWFSPVEGEHLPVRSYTVADGLLQDRVLKIKQDARGFLWFCTAGGISRFDGYGFTNFTTADGLPDRHVNDFLETNNGTIFIATDKGLARLNPQGLRGAKENPLFAVFLSSNPKAERIQTLYEDKRHQVWVGTSDGLHQVVETGGRTVLESVPLGEPLKVGVYEPGPNTLNVKAILEDRHGILWIATYGSGLFRLSPDGSIRRFTNADGFGDNKITDLLEDHDGRLWVSLRSDEHGGVCVLDSASEQPVKKCYTAKDGLGSNWIRAMIETRDGQLWLATIPGLCHWQGEGGASVCKTYTAKNDLCDDALALAEDKDGNLWMGSACGAKKIIRSGFITYNESDGLEWNEINSIFENSADELFVGTIKAGRGVNRFGGARFSLNKPRLPNYVDYVGSGWEQTIWQDKAGAWWIPTGYGLFRSPEHTSFENLAHAALQRLDTGAKSPAVLRIFEDSRGDIWMLTDGVAHELLRWERAKNVWHDYTAQVGFSGYRFGSALVEDGNRNVWIGASSDHGDSALIRYRDGEFRVLTQAEGAPSGWIGDLFLDSRGRLWIASANDGLWRLDEPNSDRFEFIKYTPANGLASLNTASVTEDQFGRIYVGSWRGLDRLNPDTGQVENFTTADGLPQSYVQIAYRDRRNILWFGTGNGLVRFVPEPPRARQPPAVLITGLRVEGEPRSVSILGETVIPSLELSSDQKQISVDFLGLGASLGEKLRYEYRLGESEWTPTTERTINFANLNSGEYRFEVRTITLDRLHSQSATVAFQIATPIWKRWWFIVLTMALAVSAVYFIYRSRLSRLLQMERMRTRIATDLHDDIGANLTKISILSEVAKQQFGNGDAEPNNPLSSIARIARESVASMGDIVWAISPRRDSLLDLVRRMREHAEEVFALGDVSLSFGTPRIEQNLRLGIDLRRDVFLIFKEAVNNAARHGRCSNVKILFSAAASGLSLIVEDDGVGFTAVEEDEGQGLPSMRRRAQMMGGKLSVASGEGRGTTIKLDVPISRRHRRS